ncbi:hypothetical protein COU56_02790 [Candidatus Pacearchaeota archaeon CG10_big_fil_rev_8_21_14_0_10_31_9]|nr:MAG: hypothetical protein AUJ62_03710 [Candidatus Pacearchaeota archaeon CG1_02_32_21]PIN94263.1 MAG: hypothetical protein COU56_02790 [Candidatus Pacearchaeota archaeon CG10_big_fil_rev_8_21_14_0_10_31_9]PIZ82618.1 MAG: hypothetical protein COX97_03855 [Candidatus Pacearchaeota archaeon CG_4_10_14_0_2_um_filter_05_32_18]
MDTARVTSGIILLIAGISLCIAGFFSHWFFIYGAILIIVGILLLIDIGKENKIEQITYGKRKVK